MKKLLALSAALLLAVASSSAFAENYNLQQKDTGTNWDNGDVAVPVGGPLVVVMDAIGTAATEFVVAHKTGKIVKVYAVTDDIVDDIDTNITISVRPAAGAATSFVPISSTVDHIVIGATGAAFDLDTFTHDPNDANQTATVNQGDIITITTDGGSTETDADTVFTIVIE
jgi:hypothetical protein